MTEEKLSNLEERIRKLEGRVAELEGKLASGTEKNEVDSFFAGKINPAALKNSAPEVKSRKQAIDWEKKIGQDWLPKVFILVLLFGVIWAFKAAADSQLITEPVRVIFGFAAAVFMLFIGEKQVRNGRRGLGLTLLGGAVAVLMLTTFAMHVLYGFITMVPAFALNVLWIAGGIYLTYKHKAQLLGILVAIGGYLVPFLLENDQANVYMFSAYVLTLYLSLFVLSVKIKQRILFVSSIGFLHLTLAAYAALSAAETDAVHFHVLLKIVAIVVIIQQAVVTGVIYKRNLFEGKELPLLFSNAALTMLWSYCAFNSSMAGNNDGFQYIRYSNDFATAYDFILFSLLILYAVLTYMLIKKKEQLKVEGFSTVVLFVATVLLIRIFEVYDIKLVLAIESVAVYIIAILVNSKFQRIMSLLLLFISSWWILEEGLEMQKVFSFETLTFLVLISVLTAMYKLIKYKDKKLALELKSKSVTVLAAALMAVLLIFLSTVTDTAFRAYTPSVQSMSVSIVWALFSIGSVIYGLQSNKKRIRFFGMIWIFITLLKLIFVDFHFLSLTTRSILFIVLGIIGMLMSRLFPGDKR